MPKKPDKAPLKISLPKGPIRSFKRKALASKDEVFALMVGTILKENDVIVGVVVEDLAYPKIDTSPDGLEWEFMDMVKLQALVHPKVVVGTIHSHPDCPPHISKQDILDAVKWGEVISGVFSYWTPEGNTRRRTSLDFYQGLKPINII